MFNQRLTYRILLFLICISPSLHVSENIRSRSLIRITRQINISEAMTQLLITIPFLPAIMLAPPFLAMMMPGYAFVRRMLNGTALSGMLPQTPLLQTLLIPTKKPSLKRSQEWNVPEESIERICHLHRELCQHHHRNAPTVRKLVNWSRLDWNEYLQPENLKWKSDLRRFAQVFKKRFKLDVCSGLHSTCTFILNR